MNNTVAFMEDCKTEQILYFETCGNLFQVGLYDRDSEEYVCKIYRHQKAAYSVYERISKAMITGKYSFEERKAIITGTSPE